MGEALDRLIAEMERERRFGLITDPRQPDNPIVYVTPDFSRGTGYASEQAVGRNCRLLQGPDTDPKIRQKLREAVAAEKAIAVRIMNYRRDGTAFLNELRIRPVFDAAGRIEAFVGIQTILPPDPAQQRVIA